MAETASSYELARERHTRLAEYDRTHVHNGNGEPDNLAADRAWRRAHLAVDAPYSEQPQFPATYTWGPNLEAERSARVAQMRTWQPFVHDEYPKLTRESEEWDALRENQASMFPVSDELSAQWDSERDATHAKVRSQDATYVDQWVNWGDVTVQVDPIKRDHWIRDTHDAHGNALKNGRRYDQNTVKHLISWEQTHPPPKLDYYVPSSRDIDAVDPFTNPLTADAKYGFMGAKRTGAREGKRPAISELIHKARLADKSREDIDAEILAANRRATFRVFDRSDSLMV